MRAAGFALAIALAACSSGGGSGSSTDDIQWTPLEEAYEITTRNLQFNESYFIASPGMPDGETSYLTTSDGYTWGAMSKAINAMWPYSTRPGRTASRRRSKAGSSRMTRWSEGQPVLLDTNQAFGVPIRPRTRRKSISDPGAGFGRRPKRG